MNPKKGLEEGLDELTRKDLSKIEEILCNLLDKDYVEGIIRTHIRTNSLDFLLKNLIDRYGNGMQEGLLKIAAASTIVLLRYQSSELPQVSQQTVATLLYEMTQNLHEYVRETMEEVKDNNKLLYAFFESLRAKAEADYDQTLAIKTALSAFYKAFMNQSIADQLNKWYKPQPIHFLPK